MTATTATTTTTPSATTTLPAKRPSVVLIINILTALLLLGSLPVIHKGQQGFVPYAKLDKGYIDAAIASGELEFMHQALKTTETARALAHESHIETMTVMQLAALAFMVLFAFNSFFLFRQHRRTPLRPLQS